MSRKLIERLQQEFGPAILDAGEPHGDATVEVAGGDLPTVLRHLRDREQCELLLDVVGVDRPERARRFEVVYLLRSLARNQRIKVRVRVAEGEAVESATPLWHSADWHEREVYDLFGVPFRNHPDLRRLLCHHEFEGHPLRKDYPIEQGQPCVTTENLFRDDEIAQAGRRADIAADGGERSAPTC